MDGAAGDRVRDARQDEMAGARLRRPDKEAGFTQSTVGRHGWALQRVEGNLTRHSAPTLLQNVIFPQG